MGKRDKYYDGLAVWDKALANTFETVTKGNPKARVGKEGAQAILDTLLADGGISRDEAQVMDQLIYEAKFDDPALSLLAEKLQEAIRVNDAFTKNILQVPANSIMTRELDYVGAFRAAHAFDWAVQYLRTRRVDVRPLLSAQIPLSRSLEAFELASDRGRSTKVQVVCD